ncbi:MAG: hypothetical protein ACI3VJ_01865 [Hominicoprocola sp.]
MPYWKNRVLKSCLAGGVLTAMLLLAVLPSTRAWYTCRETGEGSTITTADVFPLPQEPNTESVTLAPVSTYALNGEANEAESMVPFPTYRETTITLTAGGTASLGYFIVTFDGEDYYSDAVEPGKEVSFVVDGDRYGVDDFAVEACWGMPPEDVLTLYDLEEECSVDFDALFAEYEAELEAERQRLEAERLAEQRLAEQQAAEEAAAAAPGADDPGGEEPL